MASFHGLAGRALRLCRGAGIALAAALVVALPALGQEVCYPAGPGGVTNDPAYGGTWANRYDATNCSAAGQQASAQCMLQQQKGTTGCGNDIQPGSETLTGWTWEGADRGIQYFNVTHSSGSPVCGGFFRLRKFSTEPATAPCPVDCEPNMNKQFLAAYGDQPNSFVPDNTGCFGGCAAFRKDLTRDFQYWRSRTSPTQRDVLVKYQYTGLECDAEPTQTAIPNEGISCPGGVSVDNICTTPQTGENCGFINGKYVCVKQLQPDKCWVNSDGSRICAEGAATPPVPRTPDGSAPATPDVTVESCTGDNACTAYNYYNSSTVAASGTPPTGSGDPDDSPTGTPGTGPGTGGEGDGEGEEVGGGPFVAPDLADGDSYEETATGAWSQLQAAPIVAAFSSISASWPSGSCPNGTLDLSAVGAGSHDMMADACTVWEGTIAPVLSIIMLIFWSILGLRVIMEA